MRKRYNTPHRSRVVKTRMTEEEYAEFAERLSAYHMSQAEFIRQAITGAAIRPIITVSPVNDELLAAVGKLTAEYGRIGGNLNQICSDVVLHIRIIIAVHFGEIADIPGISVKDSLYRYGVALMCFYYRVIGEK